MKILGEGELTKKLAVIGPPLLEDRARRRSRPPAAARRLLREPVEKKRKTRRAKPVADEAEPEAEADERAKLPRQQAAPADEEVAPRNRRVRFEE